MRIFLKTSLVLLLSISALSGQQPPTKEPKNSGIQKDQGGNEASRGKGNKPTETPSAIRSEYPVETEPKGASEASGSYAAEQDPLYHWYLLATIVGVIGGFIGIGLIIWQSTLLRKSANAALLNAKAVIGAERARLAIDIELLQLFGSVGFRDDGTVARFIVQIRNCGKTAAWIYEMVADCKIVERFPPYPAFSDSRETRLAVHYLNPGEPFSDNFSLTGDGTYKDGRRLLIQGVVRFKDVYDKKGEATFGYWVREDGKTIHRVEESVTYNRNTYED
jgi:hypothetical protein